MPVCAANKDEVVYRYSTGKGRPLYYLVANLGTVVSSTVASTASFLPVWCRLLKDFYPELAAK